MLNYCSNMNNTKAVDGGFAQSAMPSCADSLSLILSGTALLAVLVLLFVIITEIRIIGIGLILLTLIGIKTKLNMAKLFINACN